MCYLDEENGERGLLEESEWKWSLRLEQLECSKWRAEVPGHHRDQDERRIRRT